MNARTPTTATQGRRLGRRLARWTLIVAVLLLAFIGTLHITRGTAVRHVRGIGLDGARQDAGAPQFVTSVEMLTGAALRPSNLVEIALNGDGTYDRLWQDLRSAQQSITLQIYYGAAGRTADTLRQILVERARAGVQVLVIYDAFGTASIPDEYLAELRDAGVLVEPFRPLTLMTLHLLQNRSHVRGVVIDGKIGWTGGFGIDDKWLGDGRSGDSWRETNVRFEGPAVRQMQAAFAVAWAEATGVLLPGAVSYVEHEDGVRAGLLFTSPTPGSTPAERFMALSIASATRTLYITSAYFAPDDGFANLLVEAARSGVDVRILTAGPVTDMHVVRLAGRAWYATLLEAGVRLYEWQPTTLHSKTFVVDGLWSTIGSMNFDNRSLALNDEATLMVYDPGVGRRMEEIFLDDLRHSQEITADAFEQRSYYQRVIELASWMTTRLL